MLASTIFWGQRSNEVKWDQMWKFTSKTLITVDNFPTICLFVTKLGWKMPYIGLHDILGQRSHKQVKGQMRSNVKVNLQDSITVDSFNVSLISLWLFCLCCVCWFVEWMHASGRDTLRRSPCLYFCVFVTIKVAIGVTCMYSFSC